MIFIVMAEVTNIHVLNVGQISNTNFALSGYITRNNSFISSHFTATTNSRNPFEPP